MSSQTDLGRNPPNGPKEPPIFILNLFLTDRITKLKLSIALGRADRLSM